MRTAASLSQSAFTDQLTAWSTFAMAGFTLALVIGAYAAWSVGKTTLEESRKASEAATRSAEAALVANEQARRDSIEQTRPYVYVEIVPGLAGVQCWDIRITNFGRSSARELTLSYDKWPKELDRLGQSVNKLFTTPRTLPPGCHIRAYWRIDGGPDASPDDIANLQGLGRDGTITVRYTSDDQTAPKYDDRFSVSIDNSGLWPVGEAGPEPSKVRGGDHEFYKLGQALVRRVSELGR